jgi:hypothetical protein
MTKPPPQEETALHHWSTTPKVVSIAVGLIAVLALSGCGTGARTADPTSMAPTDVSSPSTPIPSSPTPTAGITTEGIGDFKIGGSFAAAAEEIGHQPDPQCPWIISGTATSPLVGARNDGSTVSDTINIVAIASYGLEQPPADSPKTAKGIGLGSSRADVQAAYPTATAEDQPNVDFTLRYVEGGGAMVFAGRGDLVESIDVIPAADPVSSEFCG